MKADHEQSAAEVKRLFGATRIAAFPATDADRPERSTDRTGRFS